MEENIGFYFTLSSLASRAFRATSMGLDIRDLVPSAEHSMSGRMK